MIYIGIDVGKRGAIAVTHPSGRVESFFFKLNPDKSYNLCDTWKVFNKIKKYKNKSIVVIEDVYCVGGSSAQATWSFAEGKSMIECFLVAMGFKYNKVKPKAWQKVIFQGLPDHLETTKDKSIFFTQQKYPKCNLTPDRLRSPHDGIADAVCMAHYAKLKFV